MLLMKPVKRSLLSIMTLQQKAELIKMGFVGFDPDEDTGRFTLATLPQGWSYCRRGSGTGPNKMGERVEILDETGKLRAFQVEHIQAFAHKDVFEIVDN
jgi:hypothetical protein